MVWVIKRISSSLHCPELNLRAYLTSRRLTTCGRLLYSWIINGGVPTHGSVLQLINVWNRAIKIFA